MPQLRVLFPISYNEWLSRESKYTQRDMRFRFIVQCQSHTLSDWGTWLCVFRVTAASGTLRSQMRHRLFTTSTPFPPRSPSGGWDTCPKEAWMSTNVKSQGTVFRSVSVQFGVFPTGFSKPTDFQPGHTSYENQGEEGSDKSPNSLSCSSDCKQLPLFSQ